MINVNTIEKNWKFEWIKGDKIGQEEIVKDIEETNGVVTKLFFHGGNKINAQVVNEFLNFLGVVEEGDNKVTKQVDSLYDEPKTNTPTSTPTKPQPKVQEKPKENNDFGFSILDKAKRDASINININMNFDFISDDKINMLLEMYGDDLKQSLKQYIRNQISEELIVSCIELFIDEKYKSK